MSLNLPSHYVMQFATNIQLLLQQKGSRLKSTVTSDTYVGKQASPVDQIGKIEMQTVVNRFSPMGRVDAPVDRRWVFPTDYDLPQLIDSFDKLRLLTDPNSKYVENAVNAAGRQFDRLILAAAVGTAKTGEQGGTSTVLPSAQKVAVGFGAASNTGLTVAKLREAKKILMKADVDLESDELFLPVGGTQHDNLLAEVQIISSEFNGGDAPVLKEGKIMRFLGVNFIHTELSQANIIDSNVVGLPVYAKSGMHLGIWDEVATDISKRTDLQGLPWQAYVTMTAGATRLEEAKVVQIACSIA